MSDNSVTTATYATVKHLHKVAPAFSPYVPVGLLSYLAFILLTATFGLAFYFTTLPKSTIPTRETVVAMVASTLGSFGVVALFCSVGVYV
ncbi:hypothetical protein EI94DRAFT_1732553 [Lactarius quietus]|nr:hypothetical protein EI94DRAFT_1732553 [Lactarius quietus]